jgi:drug/metabolite transporter (DMT)-like permease
MPDPTRVTDQAALTTSSGRSWLVIGALISALSLGFLFWMRDLEPAGVSITGMVIIVVLYLGMIAVRFGIARLRLRLGLLAAMMIGICITFVVCALLIASAEWGSAGY